MHMCFIAGQSLARGNESILFGSHLKTGEVSLEKQRAEYYDYNLIAVILLLVGFGLVMLYSTSAYTAELQHHDDMFYFVRQARVSLVAILLAVGLSFVDYHILWKLGWVSYIGSAILMLLVKTPLGVEINGARRWLNLGITFQPSEIAKIAIILFVPMLITKQGKAFRGLKACVMPFAAGFILSFITYYFTDNLSTAIIILGIDVLIIFVAHPKTKPFIIAFAVLMVLAVVGTLVIWRIAENASVSSFRLQRILVWKNPEKYITEGGYQIMQALYAIGSGGLFGKGLGNSMQKLGWLPEAQNDMIFPIIVEELGVFGGAIVIFLFIYMLYRLLFIAENAPDLYGCLMVTGIFSHIALQVVLNICVVLGILPTTGVTLPFISYGGTSVLFLMMEIAIALSVSRLIRSKKATKDLWGNVVRYS